MTLADLQFLNNVIINKTKVNCKSAKVIYACRRRTLVLLIITLFRNCKSAKVTYVCRRRTLVLDLQFLNNVIINKTKVLFPQT
jgi:hypothetical protein